MADNRLIFLEPNRKPHYFANQTTTLPVGWCSHNAHRGKLTAKQMKNHRCREKACPFFKKNEKHPYWVEKENIKQIKKQRKLQERLSATLRQEINSELNALITRHTQSHTT